MKGLLILAACLVACACLGLAQQPVANSLLVFGTLETYSPLELGGVDGADAMCQISYRTSFDTTAVGMTRDAGKAFKAWISSPTSSPMTRFVKGFAKHYVNALGELVAHDWDHLLNGSIANPLAQGQYYSTPRSGEDRYEFITGTIAAGTGAYDVTQPSVDLMCGGWQPGATGQFVTGLNVVGSIQWTAAAVHSCNGAFRGHLICVEQDIQTFRPCAPLPGSQFGPCQAKVGIYNLPMESGYCVTNTEDYSFTCLCKPGFTGKYCDTNIDECAPGPCANGGTCNDGVGDYWCTCPIGYSGKDCEIPPPADACSSSPCMHGAVCHNTATGFLCECARGWSGETCSDCFLGAVCDTESDTCSSFFSAQSCGGCGNVCPSGYYCTRDDGVNYLCNPPATGPAEGLTKPPAIPQLQSP